MNSLSIPASDYPEFIGLSQEMQKDIRFHLNLMKRIAGAARPLEQIEEAASLFGHRRGFSRKRLVAKYYAWRKGKMDWRVFINRAKLTGGDKRDLPADFVQYWKTLCERNQRKCRPAYRELTRRYRNNDDIPGYGMWREVYRAENCREAPEGYAPDLPDGWSYGNLMRYQPTRLELTAARIGRKAAAAYRPLVFTSRVGLECGQYYLFDDLEHDLKVNLLGVNRVALRPLELSCLDLFSGCKVAYGMKPMMIDDDETKSKLKEREMRFLLAYLLTRVGYRPEGTVLCAENGTAAIREPLDKILADLSDGAIKVERAAIQGAPAIHGYYDGRGKGNFRFKAALESHHNLAHNELASLPGQMGLNRDNSPEELHGRDKVNNALIKAMARLSENRQKLIRLPFMSYYDFEDIAREVYRLINERTDHDLEGWLESRLITTEFRIGQDQVWLPAEQLLTLPPHELEATNALALRPGNSRVRKLSPAEVWSRGREKLARLPAWAVPQILGEDLGVERKVGKSGLIEFEDRELGMEIHRYLAVVITPNGQMTRMTEGEKVLTYVSPFDSDYMHICQAGAGQGAYIGVCKRWKSVCRADEDSLHRMMGAAAHEEKELLSGLNARAANLVAQKDEDAKWNSAVLAGAAVTLEEKAIRQRIKSTEGNLEDVLGTRKEAMEHEEDGEAVLNEALNNMDKMF